MRSIFTKFLTSLQWLTLIVGVMLFMYIEFDIHASIEQARYDRDWSHITYLKVFLLKAILIDVASIAALTLGMQALKSVTNPLTTEEKAAAYAEYAAHLAKYDAECAEAKRAYFAMLDEEKAEARRKLVSQ